MNRTERQAMIVTHPGVRRLKAATACEGYTGRSFKAYREGRGQTCKNSAWWRFTPLRRKHIGFTAPQNLCWSHLIHQGVYGDMDEEARTERWLKRKGF